jgi:hypothetical protein
MRVMMTDTEKLTLLLKVLKEYAEAKHCYDKNPEYNPAEFKSNDDAFDDGADYGEILFARTLLEQIGEKFEYPSMKED